MKIVIETIPHSEQRYPTVGDWYFTQQNPDGVESPLSDAPIVPIHELLASPKYVLHIKVSNLTDWRREFLIVVHELCEVGLCVNEGVSQATVDAFDMGFEKEREERIEQAGRKVSEPGIASAEEALISIEEPGDQPNAPYRKQHCFATAVERMLAAALDVSWSEYETELEALP